MKRVLCVLERCKTLPLQQFVTNKYNIKQAETIVSQKIYKEKRCAHIMKRFDILFICIVSLISARVPKSKLKSSRVLPPSKLKSKLSSSGKSEEELKESNAKPKDSKDSKNTKPKSKLSSEKKDKAAKDKGAAKDKLAATKEEDAVDADADPAKSDLADKKEKDSGKEGSDSKKEKNLLESAETKEAPQSKLTSNLGKKDEEEEEEEEPEEEEEEDKKESKLADADKSEGKSKKAQSGKGSSLLDADALLELPEKSFMFDAASGVQGAKKINLLTDAFLRQKKEMAK